MDINPYKFYIFIFNKGEIKMGKLKMREIKRRNFNAFTRMVNVFKKLLNGKHVWTQKNISIEHICENRLLSENRLPNIDKYIFKMFDDKNHLKFQMIFDKINELVILSAVIKDKGFHDIVTMKRAGNWDALSKVNYTNIFVENVVSRKYHNAQMPGIGLLWYLDDIFEEALDYSSDNRTFADYINEAFAENKEISPIEYSEDLLLDYIQYIDTFSDSEMEYDNGSEYNINRALKNLKDIYDILIKYMDKDLDFGEANQFVKNIDKLEIYRNGIRINGISVVSNVCFSREVEAGKNTVYIFNSDTKEYYITETEISDKKLISEALDNYRNLEIFINEVAVLIRKLDKLLYGKKYTVMGQNLDDSIKIIESANKDI